MLYMYKPDYYSKKELIHVLPPQKDAQKRNGGIE